MRGNELASQASDQSQYHAPSLSSPAHSLPLELLQEIFTLTCKGSALLLDPHIQNSTQFRLSQVCRLWRQAALDLSSLWSNIRLQRDSSLPPYTTSVQAALSLMDLVLPRCKSLPIDLTISDWICFATRNKIPEQTPFDNRLRTLSITACSFSL